MKSRFNIWRYKEGLGYIRSFGCQNFTLAEIFRTHEGEDDRRRDDERKRSAFDCLTPNNLAYYISP